MRLMLNKSRVLLKKYKTVLKRMIAYEAQQPVDADCSDMQVYKLTRDTDEFEPASRALCRGSELESRCKL